MVTLDSSTLLSAMTRNGRSSPELTEWLQLVWEALAEEDDARRKRKLEAAKTLLEKHREQCDTPRAA